MVMSQLLYGQLRLSKISTTVADESCEDCYKYESRSMNTSVPLKKVNDIHQTKAKGEYVFDGPPRDKDEQTEVDVDSDN